MKKMLLSDRSHDNICIRYHFQRPNPPPQQWLINDFRDLLPRSSLINIYPSVFLHSPPPPTFPFLFLQTLCLQSCPIVLPVQATLRRASATWHFWLISGHWLQLSRNIVSSPVFFVTPISQQRARARKLLMSARRRPRPERLMRESAEGVPSTNSLIIGARPLPGA